MCVDIDFYDPTIVVLTTVCRVSLQCYPFLSFSGIYRTLLLSSPSLRFLPFYSTVLLFHSEQAEHRWFTIINPQIIEGYVYEHQKSCQLRSSRRPSGLRKTIADGNSLAHRTTWLRSDFSLFTQLFYCSILNKPNIVDLLLSTHR